jgi:hypothetical protein
LTVSYTPQQNGVSERKNQTVMEMAKFMLHEKGLPKAFWAEAVYTVRYSCIHLLYLTATRPGVMFAASLLSRFMHSPSHFHFAATKRVLRYIQGTTCYGIRYCGNFMVK